MTYVKEVRENGSLRLIKKIEGETLTQQSFKKSADVNEILKRYRKVPDPSVFVRAGKGQYLDVSGFVDYHTAVNTVVQANEIFMDLDAHIRKRFDNDPGKLHNFLSDSKNRDEAISLGLLPKPKPSDVPVVSEPVVAPKKRKTVTEEEF